MSGLVDKVKGKLDQKLNNDAQPGNKVEAGADGRVNNDVNAAAGQAGVPQQFDQKIDQLADAKVNSDIPFGNK